MSRRSLTGASKFWSGQAKLSTQTEKVSYSMIVPTILQASFKNHFNAHDYPTNSVILGSHECVRCVIASFTVEFWYRSTLETGQFQARLLNERSGDLNTFSEAVQWVQDTINYLRTV